MACLTIAAEKKEVIIAVTQGRLGPCDECQQPGRIADVFNDVVEGKGRGINVLGQ
jgi:hypothetical protein